MELFHILFKYRIKQYSNDIFLLINYIRYRYLQTAATVFTSNFLDYRANRSSLRKKQINICGGWLLINQLKNNLLRQWIVQSLYLSFGLSGCMQAAINLIDRIFVNDRVKQQTELSIQSIQLSWEQDELLRIVQTKALMRRFRTYKGYFVFQNHELKLKLFKCNTLFIYINTFTLIDNFQE